MKSNFFWMILLGLIISFSSSCKKNYTCSCIDKVEDENGVETTPKEDIIFEKKKKREAQDLCKAENKASSVGGTVYSTTCTLK